MTENAREETIEDLAAVPGRPLIDVRSPEEFAGGHVPGAVNVPLDDVVADPAQAVGAHRGSDGQEIRVICQSGGRSMKAATTLIAAGIPAVSVAGGTSAWIEAGRPTET